MIEGIYTFKEDGVTLAESRNLLTTAGKVQIIDFLAKYSGSIIDSLAVGTGNTAANVADIALGFEYARVPVSFISADYATTGVIFKAILPIQVVGTIYEAGGFTANTSNQDNSNMLATFDSTEENWSAGSFNADATKINGDALRLSTSASTTTTTTLSGLAIDLSNYTNSDKVSFAFKCNDANTSTIKLRLKVDSGNYYETTINGSNVTSGYHIVQVAKSAFTITGTPSWAGIQQLEVVATSGAGGTGVVDLDGLRMESLTQNPDAILVSRTVLSSPITKTSLRPMEIEYRIRITL